MYSVLINAVLSSSPDYGLLFESLSWPRDSRPGTERVGALTAFIEGLGPLMTDSDTTPLTAANKIAIKDKIESVIWTQCLPLLSTISAEAGEGMRSRESTAAACRLMSVCVPLCDEAVPGRVALSVLPSLQLSEEEVPGAGRLNVEVASEVMAALIPSLSVDDQLTLTILTSALSCIKTLPDALVSKITVRLLVTLLNCCSGVRLESSLELILGDLCSWHSTDRTPVVTERALLCLTALSDHLLKPHRVSSSSCEPRLSRMFWTMVQDGLTHRDSVSRKRALYLLKKCVALSEEEGVDCPVSPPGEGKNSPFLTVHWLLHALFSHSSSHCCRRGLVQVGRQQEQVASRVLGGLRSGDGDPGGKPGRKSHITVGSEVGIIIYSFVMLLVSLSSAGSCSPASFKQNRHADPDNSER